MRKEHYGVVREGILILAVTVIARRGSAVRLGHAVAMDT